MYNIIRFYQNDRPSKIVKKVYTLEEAQQHCNDPETSSKTATSKDAIAHTKKYGAWFDGYDLLK